MEIAILMVEVSESEPRAITCLSEAGFALYFASAKGASEPLSIRLQREKRRWAGACTRTNAISGLRCAKER